jgi:beta-phosphoglucomutase
MTAAATMTARRPASGGLLFDLDGTLATTEHLHRAAYAALLEAHGRELDADTFATQVRGRAARDVLRTLFPHAGDHEHYELTERKEEAFRALATARGLVPTPGAHMLIAWARARGVATALVTNAPRANADLVVDVLGLAGDFDVVVSISDVTRGKPHPDPYLVGLAALGLDAAHAMAVEDSPVGVASARAAGLDVIAIDSPTCDSTVIRDAAICVADMADARLFALIAARFGLAP